MATISSFPNNVDEYVNAEQVQKWHHGRTSGVYGAANNAAVTAATGMNIGVSAGVGWLTNAAGDGIVWWIDSALTLTVGTAHASLTRYDRVVVSWQLANNSYKPTVTIVAGTPSATPTPPTLTNDSSYRQISLAKIRVPAGTTSITSGMITDERLDESVCGLVTETAAIDTSVANAQISAMIAELEAALDSVISGGLVAHASTHAFGGADALTPAAIGAAASADVTVKYDKPLRFFNTSVTTASWTSNATYPDFPYRKSVALTGVLANMVPDVVFAPATVLEGNLAPVTAAYAGGIYLYAASVPAAAFTIPTITCWKVV